MSLLPKVVHIRQFDTHRLVPSEYSREGKSVLIGIATDDAMLHDLFDIDNATNERLRAEHGQSVELGPHELVFGVPTARIVNAAFAYAHPLGSRFNGPGRGAWYASFELETSQAEAAFHKSVEYAEIGRFEDSVTYDDYLADFNAQVHDLRGEKDFEACLSPTSYEASQSLAERMLDAGALGVVYPSVRREGGTCLVCFRPSLVGNVRVDRTYRFTWSGSAVPSIRTEERS
ncbi:MAG: RES family NAD+ phosphorylase [Burkholderiales bacterium]